MTNIENFNLHVKKLNFESTWECYHNSAWFWRVLNKNPHVKPRKVRHNLLNILLSVRFNSLDFAVKQICSLMVQPVMLVIPWNNWDYWTKEHLQSTWSVATQGVTRDPFPLQIDNFWSTCLISNDEEEIVCIFYLPVCTEENSFRAECQL